VDATSAPKGPLFSSFPFFGYHRKTTFGFLGLAEKNTNPQVEQSGGKPPHSKRSASAAPMRRQSRSAGRPAGHFRTL